MEARKFELFMGCMGNGITVCNKAVNEYGDYKNVAHISEKGNIKWYVPEDYCPAEEKSRIIKAADDEKRKFLKFWNMSSASKKYETMLDWLPWNVIKPYLRGEEKSSLSLEEKVAELEIEFFKM